MKKTNGIVWMTFILVLVLGLESPAFKQSFDQKGRNDFATLEERNQNLSEQVMPLDALTRKSLAPLTEALNSKKNLEPQQQRSPSQVIH